MGKELLFCPLIKSYCKQEKCAWWIPSDKELTADVCGVYTLAISTCHASCHLEDIADNVEDLPYERVK